VNALPATLAGWDTATPWQSFVTQTALTLLLAAAVAGAVIAGAWALADALRRRAGVPFWPRPGEARAAFLYGAALGAVPALLALVGDARAVRGWPELPATAMGALLPWAESATGALVAPFWAAAGAVPFAAFALAVRGRGRRLAVAAVVVLCFVVAGAAEYGLARGLAGAAGGVAVAAATVWAFGRVAAVSWLVAALAAALLGGVRAARVAAHPLDVADGLVGALVAAVLLAVLWRQARRRADPADAVSIDATG
jgi:hypothetical protein